MEEKTEHKPAHFSAKNAEGEYVGSARVIKSKYGPAIAVNLTKDVKEGETVFLNPRKGFCLEDKTEVDKATVSKE